MLALCPDRAVLLPEGDVCSQANPYLQSRPIVLPSVSQLLASVNQKSLDYDSNYYSLSTSKNDPRTDRSRLQGEPRSGFDGLDYLVKAVSVVTKPPKHQNWPGEESRDDSRDLANDESSLRGANSSQASHEDRYESAHIQYSFDERKFADSPHNLSITDISTQMSRKRMHVNDLIDSTTTSMTLLHDHYGEGRSFPSESRIIGHEWGVPVGEKSVTTHCPKPFESLGNLINSASLLAPAPAVLASPAAVSSLFYEGSRKILDNPYFSDSSSGPVSPRRFKKRSAFAGHPYDESKVPNSDRCTMHSRYNHTGISVNDPSRRRKLKHKESSMSSSQSPVRESESKTSLPPISTRFPSPRSSSGQKRKPPKLICEPGLYNRYIACLQPSSGGHKMYFCSFPQEDGKGICGRTDARKSNVACCAAGHTGEKPWICPKEGCGYRARQSAHMRGHCRSKHWELGY